jgi:hypothetical protein
MDIEGATPNAESPKACSLAVAVFQDCVTQAIVASNASNKTIRDTLTKLLDKFMDDHADELPHALSDISGLYRQWVVRCQIAEDKAAACQEARRRAKKDANALWQAALAKHAAQLNETDEEKEARLARAAVLANKKQRRQRREEALKLQMEQEMEAKVQAQVEARMQSLKRRFTGFEEDEDDEM